MAQGIKRLLFISLFDEIHRVLAPCGLFLHLLSIYPANEAFLVATHVDYITECTMADYFCMPQAAAFYNIWFQSLVFLDFPGPY